MRKTEQNVRNQNPERHGLPVALIATSIAAKPVALPAASIAAKPVTSPVIGETQTAEETARFIMQNREVRTCSPQCR